MPRLRPTTFCETVGDVQTNKLVNTMQYFLPEVKAQTPVKTLPDEASVNTLANSIAEVRATKLVRHC